MSRSVSLAAVSWAVSFTNLPVLMRAWKPDLYSCPEHFLGCSNRAEPCEGRCRIRTWNGNQRDSTGVWGLSDMYLAGVSFQVS